MDGTRYGQAFVSAVAHKFSTEVGATVAADDALTAITYPEALHHPWPRAFAYHTEVFVPGDSPAAEVAGTNAIVGGSEHVLNVFRPAEAIAGFSALGYQHAWTNVLLRTPVPDQGWNWPAELAVIENAGEVSEANSIEPDNPCSASAIDDPFLTDLIAREGGRVVAKAQVVTLPGEPAYVSDMFTAEAARGHGYGTALLRGVLEIARRAGATDAILVPSLSTRESGFYEKRGFAEVLPISLLIPAR